MGEDGILGIDPEASAASPAEVGVRAEAAEVSRSVADGPALDPVSSDGDAFETGEFELVALDPAAFYPSPREVVDDKGLTPDEKLRLLQEWEQVLKRKLESDGEGMAPPENGGRAQRRENDAADLKLCDELVRLLNDEAVALAAPRSVLGRLWRRIMEPTAVSAV